MGARAQVAPERMTHRGRHPPGRRLPTFFTCTRLALIARMAERAGRGSPLQTRETAALRQLRSLAPSRVAARDIKATHCQSDAPSRRLGLRLALTLNATDLA